jgi:hypothetical protein
LPRILAAAPDSSSDVPEFRLAPCLTIVASVNLTRMAGSLPTTYAENAPQTIWGAVVPHVIACERTAHDRDPDNPLPHRFF